MKNGRKIEYIKIPDLTYGNVLEEAKIVWPPGSKSDPHDHRKSTGHIWILEGAIYQKVYDKKTKKFIKLSIYDVGELIIETPDIIHIMGNASLIEFAVTKHIYSPPLRMKYYKLPELKK
ncbi:MAG: hypothetical protein HYT03_01550 [Candidatus Harrisonbacteria bacterium]|nr:hypothetical protein [Candidatus Harrisonbacteria bacterium]